jgi:hypothetical protein
MRDCTHAIELNFFFKTRGNFRGSRLTCSSDPYHIVNLVATVRPWGDEARAAAARRRTRTTCNMSTLANGGHGRWSFSDAPHYVSFMKTYTRYNEERLNDSPARLAWAAGHVGVWIGNPLGLAFMIIRLPRRVLPILRIGWREQSRPRAVAHS